MIIILGPDHTGKTTLAQRLCTAGPRPYTHFDMNSRYLEDYLVPMARLQLFRAVCDRFIWCERPYAKVKKRTIQYTTKMFHNVTLLALMQKPVIILSVGKATSEYKDTYLPEADWDECLSLYREYLKSMNVSYIEYNLHNGVDIDALLSMEESNTQTMGWWIPMWRAGYGCIGSPNPDILLVAQQLGPYNYRKVPFEAGPTGRGLSEIIENMDTPIARLAITNFIKTKDEKRDFELLQVELDHLKPKACILMGNVARKAQKMIETMGIQTLHLPHLGYLGHKGAGPGERWRYSLAWKRIWDEILGKGVPVDLSELPLKRVKLVKKGETRSPV